VPCCSQAACAHCLQATFHKLASAEPQALATTLWGMATLGMQPPPAWLYSSINAVRASLPAFNHVDLQQAASAFKRFNEELQLDRLGDLQQQLEQQLQESQQRLALQQQEQRQGQQRQKQRPGKRSMQPQQEGQEQQEQEQRQRRRYKARKGPRKAADVAESQQSAAAALPLAIMHPVAAAMQHSSNGSNGSASSIDSSEGPMELPLPTQLQGVMPGIVQVQEPAAVTAA
jgi:hypothetical protein